MGKRGARAVVGVFDRAEHEDLQPAPGVSWRAFRHRITRGIWYARDDEDYTVAMAERCGVCSGTGLYHTCKRCGQPTYTEDLGALCRCPDDTWYQKCVVCDGEGVCYIPSPVRQG